MPSEPDWNITFSLNAERSGWLLNRVRSEVAPRLGTRRPRRILDLGCGCGDEAFLLASHFPDAEIIGIDISEANITEAREAAKIRAAPRVSFVCADYTAIDYPGGAFDLILADSVLHLIPGCCDAVLPKISRELAPGGILACSLPSDSLFNRLLWLVRTVLRRTRSRLTDRLIFRVARALHSRHIHDSHLRERIHYMYILPEVWVSAEFRSQLCNEHGLIALAEQTYPHDSLGQFEHRLCFFSKPANRAA
jgi:trans-aconitate methyltransferase